MTSKETEKLKLLYEIYEQPMYRIAYAVLHSTELAEDAVSDAFIRIIGRLDRIGDPKSEKTKNYIVRVIKSTAINIYRKNKRAYITEIPINEETMQIPDRSASVEKSVIDDETNRELDDLLGQISETDRNIVLLRCREELSWREVAKVLSITETAARKRFERIRKRLIGMKGEISDGKI
ncbi:MAG: sigma-70 family RNA polymerase sigma factor [Ruminococcus sp.]|nr:sigma-70 family RNA polymerase sigma factor [Ruminococcus sp.]